MGGIARMDRAHRFVEAMNPLVQDKLTFKPGQKLTVSAAYLGANDGPSEVRYYYSVIDEKGDEHELCEEGLVFDPDDIGDDMDSVIGAMVFLSGKSESFIREALKKAELL